VGYLVAVVELNSCSWRVNKQGLHPEEGKDLRGLCKTRKALWARTLHNGLPLSFLYGYKGLYSRSSLQLFPSILNSSRSQPYSVTHTSIQPLNMLKIATSLLLLGGALASPAAPLEERQSSCPPIHVFGARETTVGPGYGTAGVVVNLVLNSHSGSTGEAIVYPACGGQSSCGGVSYANSVQQGVAAVTSAVNSFNSRCPSTQIVLVGYSQVSNRPEVMAYEETS
jgi:hypothetical protein